MNKLLIKYLKEYELMSKIIKNTKIESVNFNCKTLGDLLENFDVKLNYFMNTKKKSFPLTPKTNFHKYMVIDYYMNPLYTFFGITDGIQIEYILDIRHQRIYFVKHEQSNTIIKEFDIDGELLNNFKSKNVYLSIDNLIEKYVKRDYLCYNIGELIDSFKLDIELSDELRKHVIIEKEGHNCQYCCGHRILFSEYDKKEIYDRELYVFKSMFDNDTIILDSEAPIYYIDSNNQNIFIETKGMVGTCILQFDEKNQIIEDAHSWIVDLEMFLKLTDN